MPKRQRSNSKDDDATATDFVRGTTASSTATDPSTTATTGSTDFVRGKPAKSVSALGSTTNAVEETDFLFSRAHRDKEQKKRSKTSSTSSRNGTASESTSTEGATPKHITVDSISFKTLRPGVKLLCTVRSVTKKDAVVSLPNALTGYLSLKELSDFFFGLDNETLSALDMRQLVKAGDYLRCVVRKLSGNPKSRVDVTTRASVVNKELSFNKLSPTSVNTITGHVKSIEDRGYVVHLGIANTNGFLPFKNVISTTGDTLSIGTPVTCIVDAVKPKARVVTLSQINVHATVLSSSDDIELKTMLPGMLVRCTVDKLLGKGVSVTFLSLFSATMDQFHTPKIPTVAEPLDSFLARGDKLVARIIKVDLDNKSIALSAAPHVLMLQPKTFAVAKGDILAGATILRADRDLGVYLSVPLVNDDGDNDGDNDGSNDGSNSSNSSNSSKGNANDDDSSDDSSDDEEDTAMNTTSGTTSTATTPTTFGAYAHISRLADGRVDNVMKNKTYGIATEHSCRVIGFSEFDGNVMLSLRPSTVAAKFFTLADVVPGATVLGTISKIDQKQMVLLLGERIRAICTSMHFSDIALSDPTKFFKKGSKIKVRVLSVDAKNKRVRVTHKKSLVKSSLPSISDYNPPMNLVTHGFVSDIKDYGVMVTFMNNVYGLVPTSALQKQGITHVHQAYTKGQVVKCRVVRCEPDKRRLRLSFDTSKAAKEQDKHSGASAVPLDQGRGT